MPSPFHRWRKPGDDLTGAKSGIQIGTRTQSLYCPKLSIEHMRQRAGKFERKRELKVSPSRQRWLLESGDSVGHV